MTDLYETVRHDRDYSRMHLQQNYLYVERFTVAEQISIPTRLISLYTEASNRSKIN